MTGLADELGRLALSELRKRAIALGVDPAELEAALDGDDPKASMITLAVQRHGGLRRELEGLRLSDLRKRAVAAGVDPGRLDKALDAGDSKPTMVALVMEQEIMRDGATGKPPARQRSTSGTPARQKAGLKKSHTGVAQTSPRDPAVAPSRQPSVVTAGDRWALLRLDGSSTSLLLNNKHVMLSYQWSALPSSPSAGRRRILKSVTATA